MQPERLQPDPAAVQAVAQAAITAIQAITTAITTALMMLMKEQLA